MKYGLIFSAIFSIVILYFSNVNTVPVREIDTSTSSNYLEIKQTNLELDLKIDFDNQVLIGKVSIDFINEKDYLDMIILDSWDLDIKKVENKLSGESLEFFIHTDPISEIGDFMAIKLNRKLSKGEKLFLNIYYSTNKSSKSVQWLTPAMTYGKKFPYMFTQNEPIYARSMVPCQDTPSVKIPVKASLTLRKDLVALFGGLEDKPPVLNDDDTKTYFYKQSIPIPTYLIAIAAGNIDSREISKQVVVYSEPEFVDLVKKEFERDTQKFIDTAVDYLFEYEWGKFNILVLPKAFPFGGMENPNLTFATPTLIAGDFSLTNVIAHELAHSWTGNLVTNSNWNNFWLNEGFTVFIERKINQIIYGDETRKLNSQIGYNDLLKDIKMNFPPQSESTSLYPNVSKHNPDDSFSNVPYEKGYNVLYFVEQIIGEENFKLLLRSYLKKFSKKSVQFSDFKECFDNFIKEKYSPEEAKKIHDKVTWDLFIKEIGPSELIKNDFCKQIFKL